MTELNSTEIRALRAQAHHLKPVVSISQNGVSAAVMKEIDRSLSAHELIKVKLYGVERAEREAALATICQTLECTSIQHIGNILVLWRQKPAAEAKPSTTRRNPKPQTKKQAAASTERKRRPKA
jgi:RNA-binding protein